MLNYNFFLHFRILGLHIQQVNIYAFYASVSQQHTSLAGSKLLSNCHPRSADLMPILQMERKRTKEEESLASGDTPIEFAGRLETVSQIFIQQKLTEQ